MLLDIVILPSERIRSKVGKKIQAVAKGYKHFYVVDNIKLTPHLSLFHLRVSKLKLKKLRQTVGAIVKKYTPFQLKSVRLVEYSKDTVLYFRISKPAILSQLNREITEKCRNLRDGELFSWYRRHPFSKLDRLYIQKYGSYWSTGKNFDPHLTMVKYKIPADGPKMIKKMGKFGFKFLADTVALCKINQYGQVTKVLKEFKLK